MSAARNHGPRQGTAIVWPKGVEERYGISGPTRWRWERSGKLPPRDVFIGGEPAGWRPATLAAAEQSAA
jgi:predicted DNA-binding transcriptional regulator AlpA